MKKIIVPLLLIPFFLVGCGKNKDVYASSKNTIYSFELDGSDAIITGFNDNYKNQTEIIIPYSIDKHVVKKIKTNAFYDQYRIKKVDMSKSKLTTIEDDAFHKCSELIEMNYCKTITSIGKEAFSECSSLVKMDLSDLAIEEISDSMFKKCSSLTDIKFPKTAKVLGSNVFEECNSLTTLDFTDTSFITFNEKALYNLSSLSKITLPNTLKEVKDLCFAFDKKIQFLDFSKTSLEKIGEGAFNNCRNLENISFPNTLNSIGNESFYYCEKLKKLTLNNTSVEEIPESAFELCAALQTVELSNVNKIASRAFYNSGLNKIVIPSKTTEIADDAFVFCRNLKTIQVSDDNTSYKVRLGVLYTSDYKKLLVYPALKEEKSFVCPPEVAKINAYAFADAINLEIADLTQPLSLSVIDDYTFMNCVSLKNVLIEENADYSIKRIGIKAFFGCRALESFDALSSVKEIGESAFFDCVSLSSVELKNAPVEYIGPEAFYNCGAINYLSLPATLKTIGRSAFYGCNKMTTIIYAGSSSSLETLMNNNSECGLMSYYKDNKIQHN
ncbi:MAG: leucine-rich repeat domain-containing protein [bacterium]|nr:leucine-rich repeat domain-containing protein [bacterium]